MARFEKPGQLERFAGEKLFYPKDIEGRPNKEYFEAAERIESAIQKYSGYVGIMLRGSGVGGYNTGSSDIDLAVLYDGSKGQDAKVAAADFNWKHDEDGKLHVDSQDVSLSYVQKQLDLFLKKGFKKQELTALAHLSELYAGRNVENINTYRYETGKLIRGLSRGDRALVLNAVADLLATWETYRIEQRKERLDTPEIDAVRFQEAREEIWLKRARTVFGMTTDI